MVGKTTCLKQEMEHAERKCEERGESESGGGERKEEEKEDEERERDGKQLKKKK